MKKKLVSYASKIKFYCINHDNFFIRNLVVYLKYLHRKYLDFYGIIKKDDYFARHDAEVSTIANILADERSKKIYKRLVKFRSSLSKRDLPFILSHEPQYFFKKFDFSQVKVVIDCGVGDGHRLDTIEKTIRKCPNIQKVYAFEPDQRNYLLLAEKYKNNHKVQLFNEGVYDVDGQQRFHENESIVNSSIDFSGTGRLINVRTIDSMRLENVSFIKMDIEGAEQEALIGARETILRCKPKLAISIYHSNDDMVSIANYLHSLVPEYKLYIRQYWVVFETILYAEIG
jgi:FkbM family methyltransferase